MRTVAGFLALLTLFAMAPTVNATNECVTQPTSAIVCVPFSVRPTTPAPLPGVPATPYWGDYYLYLGAGNCVPSPLATNCRGVPASPGSGIPVPNGAPVSVGQFGILYQESNGVSGLQRFPVIFGGLRHADHMVLL